MVELDCNGIEKLLNHAKLSHIITFMAAINAWGLCSATNITCLKTDVLECKAVNRLDTSKTHSSGLDIHHITID